MYIKYTIYIQLFYKLSLVLHTCYNILGFCDDNKSYEVNRRAVLASVTMGNGLSALQSFCADLNMPTPMSQHTFEYHLSAVKLAADETAEQSLSQATKDLHEHLKAPLNEVVNCRTMFDGSWRKRGHASLQGQVHASVLILEKYLTMKH